MLTALVLLFGAQVKMVAESLDKDNDVLQLANPDLARTCRLSGLSELFNVLVCAVCTPVILPRLEMQRQTNMLLWGFWLGLLKSRKVISVCWALHDLVSRPQLSAAWKLLS